MLSPEEVRVELGKIWEERREENGRHLQIMGKLDKRLMLVREQCPHTNTRKWFEYDDHGKECTDCGREIYDS